MPKFSIAKGATSVLVRVFIQDETSTTGAGLTGLAFNTSSFTCYQARDDDGNAAGTAIALVTATRGTWTSKGFVEKDSTNMPGWYEFGIPNAALATGSRSVDFHFQGGGNMAPLAVEIELTGFDNQSVTDGGLSKLTSLTFTGSDKVDASVRDWVGDTIPARSVTGVPKVDVQDWTGTAVATPDTAGYVKSTIKVGTGTGEINLSAGAVPDKGSYKRATAPAEPIGFLMTDSANHYPVTGATVTPLRWLSSAPTSGFGAGTMGAVVEAADGWYYCTPGAGDMDADCVGLLFTATGCDNAYIRLTTFKV